MSGPKHLWSGDWERDSADAARNRPEHTPPTDETEVDQIEPQHRRRPSARMVAVAAITAILVAAVGVVLANALGSAKPKPKPLVTGSASLFPKTPGSGARARTTPNRSSGSPNKTPTVQAAPGTQYGPGGSQSNPGGSQSNPGGSQIAPGGSQSNPGGSQTTPGGSQTTPGGGQTAPSSPNPAGAGQGQPPTSQFANQPTVQWLGMQIITSPTGAVVNTVQIGSEGDTAGFEPGDVIAAVDGEQITSARQIRAAVAHIRVGGQVPVEIARGSLLVTMPVTMVDRPTIQP